MKHVKSVSKKATPSKAFVWEWFVNTKTSPWSAGIIPSKYNAANGTYYSDALWSSSDSIDPTDPADIP